MVATTAPADSAATPGAPTLGAAQQRELADANRRARTVRRAAGVAAFNGWTTGLLAACSAPFAWFGAVNLLIAGGLGVVAFNEFRGRRRLLRFDPSGAALLGWNQLGFLAGIVAYCLWRVAAGFFGEGPFAAELAAKPELRQVFDSAEGFDAAYRVAIVAFYGLVIVLSLLFQGGNAVYYFTRRRHVGAYLRDTPEWVVRLQRLTEHG